MPTQVPSYKRFFAASPAASSAKRMNLAAGGKAEKSLRSRLWRMGFRYRVHAKGLPGRPDIVFTRKKLCVFVDGDFWHGRNWPELQATLEKRANPEYWIPKIQRNQERDRMQMELLESKGWTVLRFWEVDILADIDAVAERIADVLGNKHVQ